MFRRDIRRVTGIYVLLSARTIGESADSPPCQDSTMSQPRDPAETYEAYFVPAMFLPWSTVLLRYAALQPGERVLASLAGPGLWRARWRRSSPSEEPSRDWTSTSPCWPWHARCLRHRGHPSLGQKAARRTCFSRTRPLISCYASTVCNSSSTGAPPWASAGCARPSFRAPQYGRPA